jgi:hypothetical protein
MKYFIIILIVIAGIGFHLFSQKQEVVTEPTTMSLTLYVQDQEAAATSDCSVTQQEVVEVPYTSAVADASLKILFEDELSRYGTYRSVAVSDKKAMVTIEKNFNSLSSCEVLHLTSVIEDTLTQYDTIESVELYSPEGKIEF